MGARKHEPTPFGKWIKSRLVDENLQIKELAEEVGIIPVYVTKIVNGTVKESKHNVVIIDFLARDEEERIKALELI